MESGSNDSFPGSDGEMQLLCTTNPEGGTRRGESEASDQGRSDHSRLRTGLSGGSHHLWGYQRPRQSGKSVKGEPASLRTAGRAEYPASHDLSGKSGEGRETERPEGERLMGIVVAAMR